MRSFKPQNYLKSAGLALAFTLGGCGGGDAPPSTSTADESAIPTDMQAEIAEGQERLESNIGNDDANILQAGLPYRLQIVPDGKIVRSDRGGKHVVIETAFPLGTAASFYEAAGKDAGFTTSRAEGSGGITVSGKDGERSWRAIFSENGAKTKISISQTGQ